MQMSRREEKTKAGINALSLKIGEKIKALHGACVEAEIKHSLPVISGKARNKNKEVSRDSICYGGIDRKVVVDEVDLIGKVGPCNNVLVIMLHCDPFIISLLMSQFLHFLKVRPDS